MIAAFWAEESRAGPRAEGRLEERDVWGCNADMGLPI